jgi:hypothetical protein
MPLLLGRDAHGQKTRHGGPCEYCRAGVSPIAKVVPAMKLAAASVMRRIKSFSVLLHHLVCAPPSPSAGDALKREDIKLVVLRQRKVNLVGNRGHAGFFHE